MFGSKLSRTAALRTAALTTVLALSAANVAQAMTTRPQALPRIAASAANVRPDAGLTITTLDDTKGDPTFNQLLGINDQGIIAGYFGSGAAGHPNKGYTIAPPYSAKNFISDNLPGSTQTQATGITLAATATGPATTTGFWAPSNLGFSTAGAPLDQSYGFIRYVNNGETTYISVNDPLVAPSNPRSGLVQTAQVLGINTSLNAVGFYNDAAGNSHGFVYSVPTGQFSHPFVDTNAVSNQITGINNNNTICGFFVDSKGVTKGFLQVLATGANLHYVAPGTAFTQFFGVNLANEVVGDYVDGKGKTHGLLYNATTNKLTPIDVPNSVSTILTGINNNHQAVGFYVDNTSAGNTHGVVIGNLP